jgi:hypothetical protein
METTMHDLDRTLTEMESGYDEFEMNGETSFDGEFEYGSDEFETEPEQSYSDNEGVFDETEEMDLASELLSVSDEAELEQFLGKLIKRAGRAAGRFVKSSAGQSLMGILKSAAKQALPMVSTALAGPLGGAVANQLTSLASDKFGLELEGMSPEDQEFEVARRYVRFAGAAAGNAARQPGMNGRDAAVQAARRFAPGFLRANRGNGNVARSNSGGSYDMSYGNVRSGKWIRRGRKILLLGV